MTILYVPLKIKIERIEGHYTHDLGTYGDGNQFMAFIAAALPEQACDDWTAEKRWYAILHTFDSDGNHLATQTWFAGTSADGENEVVDKARSKRDEMLSALKDLRHEDIAVRLFSVENDGHIFGLVQAVDPDGEMEEVHLLPARLFFGEPWNGCFDT